MPSFFVSRRKTLLRKRVLARVLFNSRKHGNAISAKVANLKSLNANKTQNGRPPAGAPAPGAQSPPIVPVNNIVVPKLTMPAQAVAPRIAARTGSFAAAATARPPAPRRGSWWKNTAGKTLTDSQKRFLKSYKMYSRGCGCH